MFYCSLLPKLRRLNKKSEKYGFSFEDIMSAFKEKDGVFIFLFLVIKALFAFLGNDNDEDSKSSQKTYDRTDYTVRLKESDYSPKIFLYGKRSPSAI